MKLKLNKEDWQIIRAFFTILFLILFIDNYNRHSFENIFFDFLSFTFFSIVAILTLTYVLIPKFIIKRKRIILFSIITVLLFSITGMIDRTIEYFIYSKSYRLSKPFELMINGIFNMTRSVGLLLGILLTKKFYESQLKIKEIEKQRKENELKLLRNQLDPHFLFNNLNNLDSLIVKDPELGRKYLKKLSMVYRYLIKTKDKDVVELNEEIEFTENYIFLLKTCFGTLYNFNFKINTTIENKLLPIGALQTLIENAVKHNKPTRETPIKITILINEENIIVENTRTTINTNVTSFGTGLENLKIRYKNLSNKTINISDTENNFSVSIPIINLLN